MFFAFYCTEVSKVLRYAGFLYVIIVDNFKSSFCEKGTSLNKKITHNFTNVILSNILFRFGDSKSIYENVTNYWQ